jgi:hypothetical protein
VDTDAADRAGAKGAAVANNILASIPGNSVFGAFMGKTEESDKSQYIDGMSNSFGGAVQDINAAQEMGGKRVAFGKAKMNAFIREQNRVNKLLENVKSSNRRFTVKDYINFNVEMLICLSVVFKSNILGPPKYITQTIAIRHFHKFVFANAL